MGLKLMPAQWIYRVVAGLLIALAVLTTLTGARTRVIWFKICPVLLTGSARDQATPGGNALGHAGPPCRRKRRR